MNDNILEVRDLRVWFPIKKGVFGRTVGHVKAVDGVSFDLRRGETLGVVGESGCGKSTTSRAILMLNKPCGGTIKVDGVDISTLRGKELLDYHRKVQVVFAHAVADHDDHVFVGLVCCADWQPQRQKEHSGKQNRENALCFHRRYLHSFFSL